jgi:hypothetical protein
MIDKQEFFQKNDYLMVNGAVTEDVRHLLYYYMKLATRRLIFFEQQEETIQKKFLIDDAWPFGEFGDIQSPGTFSCYGDLIFDTLNLLLLPKMEELTGMKLIPTYSYYRLYKHGDDLKKHKDRKSCDISTTVCLGNDVSNLSKEEQKDYAWPIFLSSDKMETMKAPLKPGDMLIYRGTKLEHWRNKFDGVNNSQVFLHYNKAEDVDNLYDGRPELGLPKVFKR